MERWIENHCNSQQILLVGEGDFSFSACLARAFGCATNMVATSLDSQASEWGKHWSCVSHLNDLRQRGCQVLHDVNVHDMHRHYFLSWKKFDVIIFNFPHAGHYPGFGESHPRVIDARVMLRPGGEIHVTTRDDYPYNTWHVDSPASSAGLFLTEKVWFEKSDYPGYHNRRGGDIDSNETFALGESYTFKFEAKPYCMY
ncbi:uncharacterized protein At4g26485-like [Argentina anserina]|uniref:uncharacterized protein At4g26485-like n=1 Tax=Argentina anserina TaxID=57926 RepID=UPI0021763384|nr:uncharacterized protein At4g26485-like [Potentilla anserina]